MGRTSSSFFFAQDEREFRIKGVFSFFPFWGGGKGKRMQYPGVERKRERLNERNRSEGERGTN